MDNIEKRENLYMDAIVIFIGIVFIVALLFYGLNIHFPRLKKLKYYMALLFFAIGCSGWFAVFLGHGWLMTAVVSSALLLLAVVSFSIAFLFDFYDKKKNQASS